MGTEWGAGPWGYYDWGSDFVALIATGYGTGELIENYGEVYAIGSGTLTMQSETLLTATGIGTGLIHQTNEYTMIAIGIGTGTLTYETFSALVDYATYVFNMETKRTYQFTNYAFNSFGRFNKKLIGIGSSGIVDLETAATHDGTSTDIDAYFEIETDFGISNHKRLRALFGEDDTFRITLTDSAGTALVRDITPDQFQSLPRTTRDRVFTIKVANISGSQVTFRRLHIKLAPFERGGE